MTSKQHLQVNHVFGACVAIERGARQLRSTVGDLELSARNGVAKAHRLAAGQGHTLSSLTQALAEVAPLIRLSLDRLATLCATLATDTAEGSRVGRLFQEYYWCLEYGLQSCKPTQTSFHARLGLINGHLLHHPTDTPSENKRLQNKNFLLLVAQTQIKLSELERVFQGSRGVTRAINNELAELHANTRVAEYQAQFIGIEGARLPENAEAFAILSTAVRQIIAELRERLTNLHRSLAQGSSMLEHLHLQIGTI